MELLAVASTSNAGSTNTLWLLLVGWTPPLIIGGAIGFWLGRRKGTQRKLAGTPKQKDWLDNELDNYYKEKKQ